VKGGRERAGRAGNDMDEGCRCPTGVASWRKSYSNEYVTFS
jgi:hypothetical protein